MLTKETLNEALADAVMDRPREFYIDKRRFCLWSPTLGMSMMISRHIEELGINHAILDTNPTVEALRIVIRHRDKVCHILAIHTLRSYEELSNSKTIDRRAEYFYTHLDNNELSGLLIAVLNELNAETLISLSGIDEQRKKQAQIAEIKKDGHTISFGGLTIYGTLIAPAMSNLHMSFHEAVWGISLVNLKMLLADTVNSSYLSDEEAEKLHGKTTQTNEVFGMTKEDFERLKSMDWD